MLSQKGAQIILAKKDLIRKAEIIRALKCVDFPAIHSRQPVIIARYSKKCFLTRKLLSNCIQCGIYPFLKDLLLDYIKNVAFTLKFEKSTIQHVKKQYHRYIQDLSKRFQRIKISCSGTIVVDHCPTEKLLENFLEFVEKVNPFSTNVPIMDKPSSWFLLAKCLRNTCGRVTF